MKHCLILIDCSQSMGKIVEETYEGLLLLLIELQKMNKEIVVTYGGFNQQYIHGFTRKDVKYLSVLPQPWAVGGTRIFSSVDRILDNTAFKHDDDVLLVIATDGEDCSDNPPLEGDRSRKHINTIAKEVTKFDTVFVSLSHAANIYKTASMMSYEPKDCAVGKTTKEMLDQFIQIVKARI